jgi:metal-responsive CopG/Arc/MetJ family transcriptional regulator
MKTKLTISIDKELLKKFDEYCNKKSLNKSKLLSNYISTQIEKNKIKND